MHRRHNPYTQSNRSPCSKPTPPPPPTHQANYKLWPLANAINFSLVPLKLRVLFANVVSVFWNMYLSAASNR